MSPSAPSAARSRSVILACWNLPRATALGADAYRDPDAKVPAPSVTMAIRAPLQAILPIDTRSATGELISRSSGAAAGSAWRWPGHKDSGGSHHGWPREYTVLMVVARRGADVRRRHAPPVLGRVRPGEYGSCRTLAQVRRHIAK